MIAVIAPFEIVVVFNLVLIVFNLVCIGWKLDRIVKVLKGEKDE